MIIASDLDRTLMYSNRALEDLGGPENNRLKKVERLEERWVGYMTNTAFSLLQQLNQHCLFVPVTTRTTEQFKRFLIFDKEIPLTYAITSNGANILYKGHPLNEWSVTLRENLKNQTASQEELLAALKKDGNQFDGQRKHAENLFFYYLLNSLPSAQELMSIRQLCEAFGWRISLQGRKLYFIPTSISKGKALEYICNREGMEAIAGAGDSVLDWDFLKNCRIRLVPSHGELINQIDPAEMTLTKTKGVYAGEEILHHFMSALSLKA
jgi:hydroxymethylpyrimidine pyrophosphatase-like HAD family hydrolase